MAYFQVDRKWWDPVTLDGLSGNVGDEVKIWRVFNAIKIHNMINYNWRNEILKKINWMGLKTIYSRCIIGLGGTDWQRFSGTNRAPWHRLTAYATSDLTQANSLCYTWVVLLQSTIILADYLCYRLILPNRHPGGLALTAKGYWEGSLSDNGYADPF